LAEVREGVGLALGDLGHLSPLVMEDLPTTPIVPAALPASARAMGVWSADRVGGKQAVPCPDPLMLVFPPFFLHPSLRASALV
jgi:hypothetical protein